jgi:two-component system sensor histidine kinase BaeS
MVNDLQTLAGAEAAVLHLEVGRCDLRDLVDTAVDAMAPTAAAQGVRLHRELQPVVVDADATRLHQVVTNLLSNAIKFTPSGGSVDVRLRSENGDVALVVTDSGRGIEPDEVPHVFERFWRGRHTTGTAGTGIGLAIVADLVAAHGGTVTLDSEPGHGSRFTVRLPAPSTPG